ncbi:MAG: TetR family transcriptional regulator [Blastomonas sp.]
MAVRKRNAEATRARILAAAQQAFSTRAYAEVGVRDITALADVNPALVSRYFGGKLNLFEAALDTALDARLMTDLPREEFGKQIVAIFTDEHRSQPSPLAMLFGASSDSAAREVALGLLRSHVMRPLAVWFGGEAAWAKAARFMIISTGYFTYRDQLPLDEFAGSVEPRLRSWLEETFQAIVDD